MEAFVLNFKYLTRFSLVSFITVLVAVMALTAPMKLKAQDDVSGDEETIVPPSSNSNGAPPTIIDESDSNGVSDVEEYDG
jgi:hypothetical protein